jgi:hypothetical protein
MTVFKKLVALTALLIALAACAATYPGEIDLIGTTDSLNQLGADSAPQQTVVNGWTARDYLALTARQNTEVSVLVYVMVGILVVIALTLLAQNRRLLKLERTLSSGEPQGVGSGVSNDPMAAGGPPSD